MSYKRYKNIKRISIIAILILSALLFAASFAFAAQQKQQKQQTQQTQQQQKEEESSVSADTINYNINTKKVDASGNVVISRGDVVVRGEKAFGAIDKEITVTGEIVTGVFPARNANIETDKMKWSQSGGGKNGIVEAIGHVKITQTGGNRVNSDYAKWWVDTEDFQASGDVDSVFDNRTLICANVTRRGNTFQANNVVKFENKIDKYTLAALKVDGVLSKDNTITEVVATDNVVFNYTDKDGNKSIIRGAKAVYKKTAATLVITGSPNVPARAVRNDGRTVRADTIVYHEDTGNVETVGNSRITFMTTSK